MTSVSTRISFLKQGPKLTSGTFTLNDQTFMTLLSLSRRVSVSCRFNCRAVIDKGPPCSFFHRGPFGQMVAICATSSGVLQPIHYTQITRRVRLLNDAQHRSAEVWTYFVLDETMHCLFLRGTYSWMRFHSCSYQALPPTPDSRVFGELTLSHICDSTPGTPTAYTHNCDALDVSNHPVYEGEDVFLANTPT